MIGLLIATHGGFTRGVLGGTELITGEQERTDTIFVLHETSIDVFGRELANKIIELDDGDGVVIFYDLLLASPYNQVTMSYRVLQGKHEYRIISGANLPMILEALSGCMQGLGLDAISRVTQNVGKEGIQEFFEEFAKVSGADMIQ